MRAKKKQLKIKMNKNEFHTFSFAKRHDYILLTIFFELLIFVH